MSKRQSTRAAARQPRVVAGFKTFVICLLLAGIIGTAVRLYFSPPRIEKFLRAQIEKQNLPYKIDFKSARLTLARGIFPTFAVDVHDIKVSHFAPCVPEPFADASLLILPVDWFKLLTGRLQLGFVVADGVSVSVDRAKCSQMNAFELPAANDKVALAWVTRDPQQVKQWFKPEDLERMKRVMAGFEIKNGTVYFDNSKKFIQVSYFYAWHNGGELKLQGEALLPAELTYGETFPPVRLAGVVSPEVAKLEARNSFAEGELGATVELTQTEDPNAPHAKIVVRAGAMPLSIFSDVLRKLGVLSNSKLQPKFMWLNCEVSSEGPLPKLISQTPLEIDNCMVEGDSGRIDIGPAVRNEGGEWQPFNVEIKYFNLADLLKTFGEKGPSGILSSFGTLKGTLHYTGKDQQSFKGSVEELEIYFSNRNVRALQKVDAIELEAHRVDDSISGKVFNVALTPGKASGEANFSFDKKFESGAMDFDFRELSLDPKIERLMTDGIFEALSLKGKLSVENQKLTRWNGQVQAAAYKGAQLKIINPVLDTSYLNNRFNISAQAPKGELSPEAKWLLWIKRAANDINIGSANNEQWIPITNIKGQISVREDLIGWENATLTAARTQAQVMSTGEIKKNREVAGLVTIVEPANKKKKFVISGSAQNPTLTLRD